MADQPIVTLPDFTKAVEEISQAVQREFPDLYFSYAGLIPSNGDKVRADCTPLNTKVFARTGGDGVHYSLLEMSDEIQPVIMTLPANHRDYIQAHNLIIAENLNEFLSIGYYSGWFPIEQLCYFPVDAIDFFSGDNTEPYFKENGDFIFVERMRKRFNFSHIPVTADRIKVLNKNYRKFLKYDPEFIARFVK